MIYITQMIKIMKKVFIEKQVIDCTQSTNGQVWYIRDLMRRNYENLWLDKLAHNTSNILNRKQASKLIDCLLKKEEFIIVERD
jgi:aerobic-type carbon monoxide dehydrogenase small subunit (CoxS/CutS family)